METLDNILNGGAEEPAPVEAIEQVAEPETIGQPRDESGRFAAKEETGVEAAPAVEEVPPTSTEPATIPREALLDERRKRQELEAQLAFYRQQQMAPPQPQAQPQQAPDFWENPDAALQQRFEQFGQTLMQQWQQQQQAERLNQSELVARQKYTDFDEKLGAFQQAVQFNPALAREMTASPDPAEFVYSRGKTALEVQRYGSLDDLLKSERAKWEAEVKASISTPQLTAPSTIATERSVGARSGPAWAGPTPMGSILGG